MDVSIGLIGDFSEAVLAHRAIPLALELAGKALGIGVRYEWLPTEEVSSRERLSKFDGLWCVPASPYKSMDGAILGIRYARENGVPFLGTCGGFQHAIVEYSRNVLGWAEADHAESAPETPRAVIARLECALVEVTVSIHLVSGSRLARAYGVDEVVEGYHCSFGLNPEFRAALTAGPLIAVAQDHQGEVRGVELTNHPFFVGTLFQPERAALQGRTPPVVTAFVRACAERRAA